MSRELYSELAWLPRAPDDFSVRCRALEAEGDGLGVRVQALAAHGLDENRLNRLAAAIGRARAAGRSLAPLSMFRLGIVSNATTHPLVPALTATAARYGIDLVCIEAEYGQAMQAALSEESAVRAARPDAVLVAVDHRGLPLRPAPGDAQAAARSVADSLAALSAMREGFRASGALCIVQTLARPPETLFGSLDAALPGTLRTLADEFNRALAASLEGTPDLLLDVAGLAATVGLADWHDPTMWNMAKLPFAPAFLPLYADHVCRLIGALRGRSRRCLILDLDNTAWGGVVGDDGLEGIVIGQGDATGEAHLEVQRTALALRSRGVVLAVSSKNDDGTARLPFREHSEMLLREEHFAAFQANWEDKATNIAAVARALELGVDAMAFLDDNPVERGLVRRILPSVGVPELPADPALYARTLLASGLFEAVAFSAEDRKRAAFYQDNARRIALRQQAGDVESYLISLDMVMDIRPFDAAGRARIAQLIGKSNQFNLTTRRYTEAELETLEADPDCLTLQIRLSDVFGDNGMVCVVICRPEPEDEAAWRIDTWLMSCRVLGRRVEQATLAEILRCARARGIARLIGCYRPTARNGMVARHYERLGFVPIAEAPDGGGDWALDVASAVVPDAPMRVRRPALLPA